MVLPVVAPAVKPVTVKVARAAATVEPAESDLTEAEIIAKVDESEKAESIEDTMLPASAAGSRNIVIW